MTGPEIRLRPVVSWPREVSPGESYLVTVDLDFEESPEEWPYDREEYQVSCLLDAGRGVLVESVGDTTVILHRFGGTYGPAKFVAHVLESEVSPLQLTLMTAGGVPFRSIELPLAPVAPSDTATPPTVQVPGVRIPDPGPVEAERPRITLHVGRIESVTGVDILVNSENIYFQMATPYGYTVSSALRIAGARKGPFGEIIDDVLQRELDVWIRTHVGAGQPVPPGTVAPTSSGALESNGVRQVYHAAITEPLLTGERYKVAPGSISKAVHNVFVLADSRQDDFTPPLNSVCFPLFGTGVGGMPVDESARHLLRAVADELAVTPDWSVHLCVFGTEDAARVLDTLREIDFDFVVHGSAPETSEPRLRWTDEESVKVSLLGAPGAGKTSFAAALFQAASRGERPEDWTVTAVDDFSFEAGVDLLQTLERRGFPDPTLKPYRVTWRFTRVESGPDPGAGPWLLRAFRRPRPLRVAEFDLQLYDLPGEGLDYASYGPLLAEADGFVYLYDPTNEIDTDAISPNGGFSDLVAHLMFRARDRLIDGRLPHHLALCVNKLDHPGVFEIAMDLALVPYTDDPRVFGRLSQHNARLLFDAFCDGAPSGTGARIRRVINDCFLPERVSFHATSSVGFHTDPSGRVRLDDYVNVDGQGGIRGAVDPVNVLESVVGLAERIQRDSRGGRR